MHQRVLQPVNPRERQHVNHLEHQRVNQVEHQHVNHLLYASPVHHRAQAVSRLEFLHLHLHVSQAIILNALVQTEHPVIVVVLVGAVPEEAVVLVAVVLEGEVVEDADNRSYIFKISPERPDKGKNEIQFTLGKRDMLSGIFLDLI